MSRNRNRVMWYNLLMIKYNKKEFKDTKCDFVTCTCSYCNVSYSRHTINLRATIQQGNVNIYCSTDCRINATRTQLVDTNCGECNRTLLRRITEIKASKSGYVFCNRSCAASYNNKHKTHGTRRSKMEAFLEDYITNAYPNVVMLCNNKTAIGSELDFYFPELKFAIELNGIFHYEPIFGEDKLTKIQNNDNRKIIACYENNIELAIIDSSSVGYITAKVRVKYSGIVKSLLNNVIKQRKSV